MIEKLIILLEKEIKNVKNYTDIENIKKKYFKDIADALYIQDKENRKLFGYKFNQLKQQLQDKNTYNQLKQVQLDKKLDIDLTLTGISRHKGSKHLITRVRERVNHFFYCIGFNDFYDNNQIDTAFYNFDALNIQQDHPSRSIKDTFYINKDLLLRTHTSGSQIRALETLTPPFRIITSGSVYRRDNDRTHTPVFHQLEGFVVDTQISFSNLISILKNFLKWFFGYDIQFRLRPAFFPFTEPSAEIDIKINGQWLEVLGCGVTTDNIIKNYINDKSYKAIAFGMGLERLAMIKYNLTDIRDLYRGDINFIEKFKYVL